MSNPVGSTLEAAAMVLRFLLSNVIEGTGFSNALARCTELLTRAQGLVVIQLESTAADRAASARRRVLRHTLQVELLRYLTWVGAVAGRDQEEMAKQLKLPNSNQSHLVFVSAAKTLLAKAEAQKDALIAVGMSETLLADLEKGLADFEAASDQTRDGRRGHIAARAELEQAAAELREQIRMFDGMVRYEFRKDPEKLQTWISVSNIIGSKSKPAVPPAEGGVVPPAPGSVSPAA
jgi:hypothetical protein